MAHSKSATSQLSLNVSTRLLLGADSGKGDRSQARRLDLRCCPIGSNGVGGPMSTLRVCRGDMRTPARTDRPGLRPLGQARLHRLGPVCSEHSRIAGEPSAGLERRERRSTPMRLCKRVPDAPRARPWRSWGSPASLGKGRTRRDGAASEPGRLISIYIGT